VPFETNDPLAVAVFYIEAQEVAPNLHHQDFAFDLYDRPLSVPNRRQWMESYPPSFFHPAWRVKRYFSTAIWRFTL
jgi:hypothetical protein